ncbi:hypothetical protein HPB50_004511 [Hyalomma asiaticum]|uniref:Uncharacterized protein n=1 Tax=Hyalomma asiaticum TaxID=266040 RepID=A0ACB7RV98_HYAAI|nr:hypothetical protein HPB50_004511 [Hyalomma asiaticum]
MANELGAADGSLRHDQDTQTESFENMSIAVNADAGQHQGTQTDTTNYASKEVNCDLGYQRNIAKDDDANTCKVNCKEDTSPECSVADSVAEGNGGSQAKVAERDSSDALDIARATEAVTESTVEFLASDSTKARQRRDKRRDCRKGTLGGVGREEDPDVEMVSISETDIPMASLSESDDRMAVILASDVARRAVSVTDAEVTPMRAALRCVNCHSNLGLQISGVAVTGVVQRTGAMASAPVAQAPQGLRGQLEHLPVASPPPVPQATPVIQMYGAVPSGMLEPSATASLALFTTSAQRGAICGNATMSAPVASPPLHMTLEQWKMQTYTFPNGQREPLVAASLPSTAQLPSAFQMQGVPQYPSAAAASTSTAPVTFHSPAIGPFDPVPVQSAAGTVLGANPWPVPRALPAELNYSVPQASPAIRVGNFVPSGQLLQPNGAFTSPSVHIPSGILTSDTTASVQQPSYMVAPTPPPTRVPWEAEMCNIPLSGQNQPPRSASLPRSAQVPWGVEMDLISQGAQQRAAAAAATPSTMRAFPTQVPSANQLQPFMMPAPFLGPQVPSAAMMRSAPTPAQLQPSMMVAPPFEMQGPAAQIRAVPTSAQNPPPHYMSASPQYNQVWTRRS